MMSEDIRKIWLAPVTGFLLALSFLTRIPVNPGRNFTTADWNWAAVFFPFCGYVIGVAATIPLYLIIVLTRSSTVLDMYLLTVPVWYLIVSAWMSRMLHLDGFCDCCDAFTAVRSTPEQRLEIMKDPHPGAGGVGGTVLLLFGKGLFLFLIVMKFYFNSDKYLLIFASFIMIPVLARFAMLVLAATGKYPRETGAGAGLIGKLLFPAVIGGVLFLLPMYWLFEPAVLLSQLCVLGLVVVYWRNRSTVLLGGVTGDVLGACCESAELAAAAVFLYSL